MPHKQHNPWLDQNVVVGYITYANCTRILTLTPHPNWAESETTKFKVNLTLVLDHMGHPVHTQS